jgi:hypothetical protein
MFQMQLPVLRIRQVFTNLSPGLKFVLSGTVTSLTNSARFMQSPWSVGVGAGVGVSVGAIVAEGDADGSGVMVSVSGIVVGATLGSGVAVGVDVEPQALNNKAAIREMIKPIFFVLIFAILNPSIG